MRKTFTPCPDNFGKLTQNTGVTAGPVACPSVVCCTTNTNHIKNNYKDACPDFFGDSANAGSFSFIQKNNLNTTAFMKTLLRKSKVLSLVLGLLMMGFLANAGTYFLTSAGQGSAQTPANWNTNAYGTGTPAANFTTGGDIFIIPSAISGVFTANTTFGGTGNNDAVTF